MSMSYRFSKRTVGPAPAGVNSRAVDLIAAGERRARRSQRHGIDSVELLDKCGPSLSQLPFARPMHAFFSNRGGHCCCVFQVRSFMGQLRDLGLGLLLTGRPVE